MFYRKAVLGFVLSLVFLLLGYALLAGPYTRWIRDEISQHADDTASALASFIGQQRNLYSGKSKTHWSNRERATILAFIESLIDGGDFKLIELRSPEGDVLVSRYHEVPQQDRYFERWFHFPLTVETATVYHDWQPVGEVVVVPDEQYAHNYCTYWFVWYVFAWLSVTLVWFMYAYWHHRKTSRLCLQLARFAVDPKAKPLNPKHYPYEYRALILALNERAADAT